MHVDGFRFDLASTLARELHDVDRLGSFFDLIQQDPVINQVKLIAEPWDVGEGGYQVGNFPPLWSEWNGKYRDCVRDFWRGTDQTLAEFGSRFTGSSDLYQGTARRPYASINFITAHDGFTLHDLVSYNEKHNEANGEDNRDGENHNRSWNCGAEGPTDDPDVLQLRHRQMRNFLATLFLSQGVPMLLRRRRDRPHAAGQQQRLLPGQRDLLVRLGARRRDAARLHARSDPAALGASGVHAAAAGSRGGRSAAARSATSAGSRRRGTEMSDQDWQAGFAKSLGVFLNGNAIPTRDERGRARGRRQLLRHVQRPLGAGRVRAAGVEVGRAVDDCPRHQRASRSRRRRQAGPPARAPASACTSQAGRSCCCGGSPRTARAEAPTVANGIH